MSRPTSKTGTPRAECQGCEFTVEHRGALGSAAIHHDATGHVVRVDLNTVIVYGDQTAALEAAGQTRLDVALEHQV